jgi:hypothetical protein
VLQAESETASSPAPTIEMRIETPSVELIVSHLMDIQKGAARGEVPSI